MRTRLCVLMTVLAAAMLSCGSDKKGTTDSDMVETHEVTDSVGHKVGNAVAYAKIRIDEPDYISDICKKNFAMWLSTVLEMEKSSDKDAVHSLTSTFTHVVAARHENSLKEMQAVMEDYHVDELFTTVNISKSYENDEFVTYIFDEESYEGGPHGSHINMGYTFKKSDLSLADLIKPEDVQKYRKAITDRLSDVLEIDPSKLMETLFIEDDCKKEGLVPLPAGGAFLENDSLVFQYQQYEIVPYSYGLPCVKLPYKGLRG